MKIAGFGAGFEADFDFVDSHGRIDTSEMLRYLNASLSSIHFNEETKGCRLNIFIDELNISFVTGSVFKRDATLIRDLVASCAKMNLFFQRIRYQYIFTLQFGVKLLTLLSQVCERSVKRSKIMGFLSIGIREPNIQINH